VKSSFDSRSDSQGSEMAQISRILCTGITLVNVQQSWLQVGHDCACDPNEIY
jgi:hypothetical protein